MGQEYDPFETDNPGANPLEKEKATQEMTATETKQRATQAVKNAEAGTYADAPRRASDFAPKGEFTPMAALNGIELELFGIEDSKSKHGPCLLLNVREIEGETAGLEHKVFTSGQALVPALNMIREAVATKQTRFPLLVKFVLVTGGDNPYWTLE